MKRKADIRLTIRKNAIKLVLGLYFFTSLVPAFKSIPRVPSEQIYIYLWFLIIFAFRPSINLSKEMVAALPFLIVHVLYVFIDNYSYLDPRVTETQADIFIAVFFATSLWSFLRQEHNPKIMRFLAKLIIFSIGLTCITTIVGLTQYPNAARDMIGSSDPQMTLKYLRMNIGSYSFQYILVFVGPLFLYYYKISKEKYYLIGYFLATTSVLYAQIVSIILLYVLNSGLTFLMLTKLSMRRYFTLLSIGSVLLLLGKDILSLVFLEASKLLSPFGMVSEKFTELAYFIGSSGQVNQQDIQNIYGYQFRYKISEASFLNSPIVGGGQSGGHHFWMDNLAEHGILGTITWVFVFWTFYTTTKKVFNEREHVLIINAMVMFILIGINKNILIYSMPSHLFFVVPLLLLFFHYSVQNQKGL